MTPFVAKVVLDTMLDLFAAKVVSDVTLKCDAFAVNGIRHYTQV